MKNIEVKDEVITRGVCMAARSLGVSYNHLWKVLSGKCESIALVLKVNRECPSLFGAHFCTIDYKSIVKKNAKLYEYDEISGRYFKKR